MTSKIVALVVLAAFTVDVHAGGLWIYEFGAPAQGRASAGAQAGVDDASAALYNPASMTRLEGHQLQAGLQVISAEAEFDTSRSSPVNGFGDGGDQGDITPAGGLFYTARLSEKWSAGVSLAGWSGAVLDPNDNWVGRFQTTEVELLALAVMPAVGYKINDFVSVGLGVPVMYTDLTLRLALPNINDPFLGDEGTAKVDGDDFVSAVNVSALFTLSDATRVGIVYSSKFEAEYGGDFSLATGGSPLAFQVAVDTEIPFAEFLRIGATHAFSERLRGHYTFGWEGWSEMENVIISGESGGAALPRNWHDTYHNAVGFEYDLNPRWTLQGGFAYDTSPVNKNDRTADMPIDEQYRYTAGAQFRRDNGQLISASLVYADYGDAEIDATGFAGEYKTNELFFLAVSMDFSFNRGFRESGR
jgi:long-chain fatty acid transport protein